VIYVQDADLTLHHGDVREVLASLPAGSVDCVITSPPYYGLRDYATPGQIGLEPTLDAYITQMVAVFREVHRVLADHGTCFVNMGDSFAEKQLLGVPWKLAFALQDWGWFLRSDIIWAKLFPTRCPRV
jgi:DNA modification methylase